MERLSKFFVRVCEFGQDHISFEELSLERAKDLCKAAVKATMGGEGRGVVTFGDPWAKPLLAYRRDSLGRANAITDTDRAWEL